MANNYVSTPKQSGKPNTCSAEEITRLYQKVGWIGRSHKVLRLVPKPFFDVGPGLGR